MNILTFDIEEWFHILDNDSTKTENEWSRYPSRIHANMDRLFSILDRTNQKATFFCLGWVAEKYPEILKKIDELGFEIGTHSHRHQLVYEQEPQSFKKDLHKSIDLIEQAIGKKVKSYRSPGFSLTEECLWVFEILNEFGIEIDCSIFPANRSHGGFRNLEISEPFQITTNGVKIKEFPVSFWDMASFRVMFSGGGYFRLLPYELISRLTKRQAYIMTYFHPRDFDPDQPIISGLSPLRRFKSYYGLSGSESKLLKYLSDFEFMDLHQADKLIDWTDSPQINLGE